MAEIVTCERCSREHAASFARCPFCNAPRAALDGNAPFRANAPPPPVETRTPEEIEREARLRAAMVAMSAKRGHHGGDLTRASAARVWLMRAGASLVVGGLLLVVMRCAVDHPIPVRGANALGANSTPPGGFVLDARIDWKKATRVDSTRLVTLRGVAPLLVGGQRLRGRRVLLVDAKPLTAMLIKTRIVQYRKDVVQRVEWLRRRTRIYAPLAGSGLRAWVVSLPTNASDLADPRVAAFKRKRAYSGVVRPLRELLRYKLLGEARDRALRRVPADAVAVVATPLRRADGPLLLGEIAGSGGKLFAVASALPAADVGLFGHFAACPSRACARIGDPKRAHGYFFVTRRPPARASRVHPAGLTALLLGLLLLIGPPLARRLIG